MTASPPPLLIGRLSHEDVKEEPVYLDHRGRLLCGGYVFKDDRTGTCRRYYRACMEYLNEKGRQPDVSDFREKRLMDVVHGLDAEGRDSISKTELIEIAGPYNQVASVDT